LPMLAHRYAAKQIKQFFSLWNKYLLGFIIISGSFVLATALLAHPLVHRIYGGKFDEVSTLLGTLALVPLIMAIGNTMNAAMKSVERPNMVLYAYVASGITTFVAGIPLVIRLGLRGAVYGMVLSAAAYALTLGIGFTSFRKRMQATVAATAGGEHVLAMSGWLGRGTGEPGNVTLVGSNDE